MPPAPPAPVHDRLLAAMAALVDEVGWAKVTTDQIARRAQTSKRAVYAAFGSKPGAFRALYAHEARQLQAAVAQALDGVDDPEERVRAGITAYVARFEGRPRMLRDMLLETLRQGPEGVRHRRQLQQGFVQLVAQELARTGLAPDQAALWARLFVGGAHDMLLEAVEDPDRPQLAEMRARLLQMLALVPRQP